jgi:hypothetical protein
VITLLFVLSIWTVVGMAAIRPKRTAAGRVDEGVLALRLFDQLFPAPSWAAWRAWACGVFATAMSEAEADLFRRLTGRTTLPTSRAREVWTVAGRRSGKSRMAAFIAVFLAACRRYTLAPGERAVVLVISPGRAQSRVIFNYALAMLRSIEALAYLIERETADSIDLSTGVSIQIASASFRTPRGYTVVGLVADELAFWRDDTGGSANPDVEIIRAIRPSLASVAGSLLVAISSPYAPRGELHRNHERHYGKDSSDILVAQSDSRTLNPTLPQQLIDQAFEDDPASAAAEWGGQFRSDLETLYAREALDAVIRRARFELAPIPGVAYIGFVDPSGGSADSMTLAIAHRDAAGVPVLDLLREAKPPFSPEAVTLEFARTLQRYGISKVTGDKYAGEWPREQFRKHRIEYATAELTRSELYLELLPLVNSGGVELLDHNRLLGQLAGLERRVGRTGKDSIDHRPGSHDDVANAAAGALVHALRSNEFATLPESFKWCNRAESIASFSMTSCYLFRGAFKPPADICCSNCEGHKFVLSACTAHKERTGEGVYYVEFYRQRITPNELVSRVLANRWADAMGI